MLGLGDLLTEVQRNAPVIHIVLNNGMLDFVNIEQQEAGFIPFGTDFSNPDFGRVAEALGATGIRVEEPGDVREGLQTALAHAGGLVVVDVVADPYALARPATCPRHQPEASPSAWPGKSCTDRWMTSSPPPSTTCGSSEPAPLNRGRGTSLRRRARHRRNLAQLSTGPACPVSTPPGGAPWPR